MEKRRIVVGISGASGAPLAVEMLCQLQNLKKRTFGQMLEVHLVYTKGALCTLHQEMDLSEDGLRYLADVVYDNQNIGAAIASGTFQTEGMVVVPCSMKTVAGICSGYSENLLLRAADVTLKERRKLVLVARESPMSAIHLRNLQELSMMGAMILPPMLTYYHHPESLEDATRHIVGKILEQFGLPGQGYDEWDGKRTVPKKTTQNFIVTGEVLERIIWAHITRLGDGFHILLVGGDKSHVGAVAFSSPGISDDYGFQVKEHREGQIAQKWAQELSRHLKCPVTVNCGIHYDNVKREEIKKIVEETDRMLEEVLIRIDMLGDNER